MALDNLMVTENISVSIRRNTIIFLADVASDIYAAWRGPRPGYWPDVEANTSRISIQIINEEAHENE